MTAANTECIPPPHSGTQQLDRLRISWRAHHTPHGWRADCELQLGDSEQARARLTLSDGEPRKDYLLRAAREQVWGCVALSPEAGETALCIDYHAGCPERHSICLDNWRACSPDAHVEARENSCDINEQGWMHLRWIISGAKDACQKVTLSVAGCSDTPAATHVLLPGAPCWDHQLRHHGKHADLRFDVRYQSNGRISLHCEALHASGGGQHLVLAVLPGGEPCPPGPGPEPDPGQDDRDTEVLAIPRTFASFTYPRALQPPGPRRLGRCFLALANGGSLQTTLSSQRSQSQRAQMQVTANAYIADPSQYVASVGCLPGVMGGLHGPAVTAFLALHPASRHELAHALHELTGLSADELMQDPDYLSSLPRLQDSVLALLVAGKAAPYHSGELLRALMVCHVAQWLTTWTEAASPRHLREVLQASATLPAGILPLPDPPAASSVTPLGYADVQVMRQRLRRYRLGELAHVENVMRGETREDAQQQRLQDVQRQDEHSGSENDVQQMTEAGGRSRQAERNASSPIQDLKREFDTLQKEYASDGLSVTVTGGWTDKVDGPAVQSAQAARHARDLLERAASRVARKVVQEQRRRTLAEFSEQRRRCFDNAGGKRHLTGVYHWIEAVHQIRLDHAGDRLILACTLCNPAAAFLQRSNALHGLNLSVPVPPWEEDGGVGPITCAADINRSNYQALAARYCTDVGAPPPALCTVNASLGIDPPNTVTELLVPPGYVSSSASIAYAWNTPSAAAGAPPCSLAVLLGSVAQPVYTATAPSQGTLQIPALPASDTAVPVSVVGAGLQYAINISMSCQCVEQAPPYCDWQAATYAAIMDAYRCRLQETEMVMAQLADQLLRPGNEGRRETEREELCQGAIQALIAPALALGASLTPPLAPETIEFDLIPFFRQAIEWRQMTFSYAGRYQTGSTAWLRLAQATGPDDGFGAFLQAGAATLLLPVRPDYILPMLFYLSANGSFWYGQSALCPVFESDLQLANEWKLLAQRQPAAGSCWDVEVATDMLMLLPDKAMPDFGPPPGCRLQGSEHHE